MSSPKAEIISIGTELLIGSILNTNAKFLSEKLAENAIDVYRQSTVGDNIDRIVAAFKEAAFRSDILITSGGLGPTADDVTLEALSKFISKPLVLHKPTYRYIVSRLKSRGFSTTKLVLKQCYVPADSKIIQNHLGTAPGVLTKIYFQNKTVWILVLPGPPRELEPMFTLQALPLLKKTARIHNNNFLIRSIKIAALTEAQVAQEIPELLQLKPPVTVGIYAKPDEVELKIMAKDSSLKKTKRLVSNIEKKIRLIFKQSILGADGDTFASVVGDLLRKNKKTLASAESCTGGLFSKRITDTPGSSNYYIGGVISYQNRIKTIELGILPKLLFKNGAVSRSVAETMAKTIRTKFGADYGIGITGIAGPGGGSPTKPVGLVYIALASKNKIICKKKKFFGNRKEIRSRAANYALNFLRLELLRKN